jgi:hypothetical protein
VLLELLAMLGEGDQRGVAPGQDERVVAGGGDLADPPREAADGVPWVRRLEPLVVAA